MSKVKQTEQEAQMRMQEQSHIRKLEILHLDVKIHNLATQSFSLAVESLLKLTVVQGPVQKPILSNDEIKVILMAQFPNIMQPVIDAEKAAQEAAEQKYKEQRAILGLDDKEHNISSDPHKHTV